MLTIAIENEWIETAQLFGQVENVIKQALRAYAVGQCQQRIDKAIAQNDIYQQKYHLDYATFKYTVQTNEQFLNKLESQSPLWEEDAMEWAFWQEEEQAWRNRLKTLCQI